MEKRPRRHEGEVNMTKRLFYDLESDSEHPQYCNMSLFGILEESWSDDTTLIEIPTETVYTWQAPFTDEKLRQIEYILCEPGVQRVGFNNLNYDDIVLANYGITVPEEGTEDAMLAIKTCLPGLPSHGLKFLSWYLLGDPHWEEFAMLQKNEGKFDWKDLEVSEELKAYHCKDLYQHRAIWDYIKDKVQEPLHLSAYKLDMGMKFPLQEMTFEGGTYVDIPKCIETLEKLEVKKAVIEHTVKKVTNGEIKNINSTKQVGKYLDAVENWQLNLTGTGEFQVKKKDLAEITGMEEKDMRLWTPDMPVPENFSTVALLAWQMKDNETLRKYVKNYHTAAIGTDRDGWIPNAYGISRAATRRTLSKSYYKINFQNSTEAIDEFKLVPPGYLGWFIDSTQVENVVHIYESSDIARRKAYETDENWNEYVWLCNRIHNKEETKEYWDSIKSRQVGHWTIYKLYKTIKLALNFGMGVRKFCKTIGIDEKIGRKLFDDIHRACPAIRFLQDKVEQALDNTGFVQDSFGHIYTGPSEEAYKVVAYLIQGCGTGSLPKAQLRANYDSLHRWSDELGCAVGPLCTTTHDENSGILRLDLGREVLDCILQELMENMTSKFSPKFDDIPLRAKLYLSVTNTADKKKYETKNYKQEIIYPHGLF